jgi:hypothetical protein
LATLDNPATFPLSQKHLNPDTSGTSDQDQERRQIETKTTRLVGGISDPGTTAASMSSSDQQAVARRVDKITI